MSQNNRDIILRTWPFLSIFFLFIFISCTFLAYHGKDELHLNFNRYNNLIGDYFFRYYTDIASNVIFILLIIYLIFKSTTRYLLILIISHAAAWILSTTVKRIFFIHVHRPTYYFSQKGIDLNLVEGVRSQIPYTFPSGHTLLAAMVFLMLSLLTKNRYLQFLYGILFVLVAIGRVYLSKHFILDTIGGGIIGLAVFIAVYYIFVQSDKPFLNRSLTEIFRK